MAEIGLNVRLIGRQQRFTAGASEPRAELTQVTPVTFQRIARKPVFQPQSVAEFVEYPLVRDVPDVRAHRRPLVDPVFMGNMVDVRGYNGDTHEVGIEFQDTIDVNLLASGINE